LRCESGNVPDDIRASFKGVRSPDGIPYCDNSDGHRTNYAGGYWVPIEGAWWRVLERAVIRNAGNPLTKPSFGVSTFAATS
jgi:hypothetical protein